MQTLKKHGLERFDPSQHPGTKFDPALHEATFQTKAEGKADGDVIMVQQKGFMLNGRVLRVSFFSQPPSLPLLSQKRRISIILPPPVPFSTLSSSMPYH